MFSWIYLTGYRRIYLAKIYNPINDKAEYPLEKSETHTNPIIVWMEKNAIKNCFTCFLLALSINAFRIGVRIYNIMYALTNQYWLQRLIQLFILKSTSLPLTINIHYIIIFKKYTWNKNASKREYFVLIPYHPEIKTNTFTQIIEIDSLKRRKKVLVGFICKYDNVGAPNALKDAWTIKTNTIAVILNNSILESLNFIVFWFVACMILFAPLSMFLTYKYIYSFTDSYKCIVIISFFSAPQKDNAPITDLNGLFHWQVNILP